MNLAERKLTDLQSCVEFMACHNHLIRVKSEVAPDLAMLSIPRHRGKNTGEPQGTGRSLLGGHGHYAGVEDRWVFAVQTRCRFDKDLLQASEGRHLAAKSKRDKARRSLRFPFYNNVKINKKKIGFLVRSHSVTLPRSAAGRTG